MLFYRPREHHLFFFAQSFFELLTVFSKMDLVSLFDTSYGTPFQSDPIGGSEPVPGCSFNSFCLLFICFVFCFFFVKVSLPKSPAQPKGQIRTRARFTLTVFIYLIKTFYLCHFVLGFSITLKHFQMVGP